jgi:tetratricopeptide (TPR) repeat protein
MRQAQALVEKGKDLYQNDQDEEAVDAFQQAIKLKPDLAEGHFRLGLAYNALERKPEADEALKKSISLYKKLAESDPKNADALFNMGEAYSILHLDEDAARAFRQVARLRPNDEEAFYQLGVTETRLAQYDEAATAFSKALEIDPDDYRASEALDNAREGVKRIKEGKKHAEDQLKKQQANANVNGNVSTNTNTRAVPRRSPPKP